MQYDYILIAVSNEKFGSVYYSLLEKKVDKGKLIAIDIGEKPGLDNSDVVVDDIFYEIISDNRNWDKKIKDYNNYGLGKNNRDNLIYDNRSAAELLLKGYRYENPVFHVINEQEKYMGSISKEAIRRLSLTCVNQIKTWSVASVINELNKNKIHIDFSVGINDGIFELITLFSQKNLDEVVILENGEICNLIRRLDFYARFDKPVLNKNSLYMANRYHLSRVSPFHKYEYSINSQAGEDGVIAHIFQVIGFESYYAVEFGAWDGVYLSNVRNLILNHDMNVLFIEGNPDKIKDGIQNYLNSPKVKFITEYIGIHKYRKLEDILDENNVPVNLDILSIDIDGWDYWVWDSLEKYRPRVIVVEFNQTIYRDWVVINPRDEISRTGSSARALVELGVSKGYELLCITGTNLIFCVKEEFYKFGYYDNSLEALWPYSGLQCLFATFNGDVYGDPWKRNGKGVLRPIN